MIEIIIKFLLSTLIKSVFMNENPYWLPCMVIGICIHSLVYIVHVTTLIKSLTLQAIKTLQ